MCLEKEGEEEKGESMTRQRIRERDEGQEVGRGVKPETVDDEWYWS